MQYRNIHNQKADRNHLEHGLKLAPIACCNNNTLICLSLIHIWQYAMDYIEYHQESKTKQKLLQSLMSKGLSNLLLFEFFLPISHDFIKAF